MKTRSVSIKVGQRTFTAELPVMEVAAFPGKELVAASEITKLEQAAVQWILEHGSDGPDSLKLLRSVAGLTGSQLAELLGTDRARISDWENGKANPGRALYAVLAALARDAISGETATVDYLRAMGTEQDEAREIKLAVG